MIIMMAFAPAEGRLDTTAYANTVVAQQQQQQQLCGFVKQRNSFNSAPGQRPTSHRRHCDVTLEANARK